MLYLDSISKMLSKGIASSLYALWLVKDFMEMLYSSMGAGAERKVLPSPYLPQKQDVIS